jgi:rare lipoprotein A
MTLRPLALAAVLVVASSLSHAQSAASPSPAAATAAPEAAASDGKVAYYGRKFAGRKTANGERFNPNAMTMAHKTLPMGTMVKVTNTNNGKNAVVRVNDRGPTTPDRVGDLSLAAAKRIGMVRSGVVEAKLETVGTARAGKSRRAMRKA